MKLSQINRTSVVSWSPASEYTNYIACGSRAGALEADFSSKSKLDVFSISLDSKEGELLGTIETKDRFNKISWGNTVGVNHTLGLLAGATTDSSIRVWDPELIVQKAENAELAKLDKHKSQIKGLDFNPRVYNYLASGSEDSAVYLWDLEKPTQPTLYNLDNKYADQHKVISNLKWNACHNNILATTSKDGSCVIWNVEKRSPIIMFENPQGKNRYSSVSWNPEVMTQLAVGSEDDNSPYIEIWELKTAYEPLRVLKGHHKGILSLHWCPFDSNLLVSTGKDGRTIIWNPNSGEMLGELPTSKSWMFDVQWSFRPSIFSTASFDSKVQVYSLQDSSINVLQDGDPFRQVGEQNQSAQQKFKTAPKWIQRPVCGNFGFGAKLVSVDNKSKKVKLFKICHDEDFIERVGEMDSAMKTKKFVEYCAKKSEENHVWTVMKLLFTENKQESMLNYLGYNEKDIEEMLENCVIPEKKVIEEFEDAEKKETVYDDDAVDILIQKALIVKNFRKAVEICSQVGRHADALIISECGGEELMKETKKKYLETLTRKNMKINLAIMRNDLPLLIEECDLNKWKNYLAIVLNFCEDKKLLNELVSRLAERLDEDKQTNEALVCFMFAGNFEKVTASWTKDFDQSSAAMKDKLIEFIEKIMVFKELAKGKVAISEEVSKKFLDFANILASLGELNSTLIYLNMVPSMKNSLLRHRVYNSISKPFGDAPKNPFKVVVYEKKQKKKRDTPKKQNIRTFDPNDREKVKEKASHPPPTRQRRLRKKKKKKVRRSPVKAEMPQSEQIYHPGQYVPKETIAPPTFNAPPPRTNVLPPTTFGRQPTAQEMGPPPSFSAPPVQTFQPHPPTQSVDVNRGVTGMGMPPPTSFTPQQPEVNVLPPTSPLGFQPAEPEAEVPKEEKKVIKLPPRKKQERVVTVSGFKDLSFELDEDADETVRGVIERVEEIFNEVYGSGNFDYKKNEEQKGRKDIYRFFMNLKNGKVNEEIVGAICELLKYVEDGNKQKVNRTFRGISKDHFKETKYFLKSLKFLLLKKVK